jgi:hypothetical protein
MVRTAGLEPAPAGEEQISNLREAEDLDQQPDRVHWGWLGGIQMPGGLQKDDRIVGPQARSQDLMRRRSGGDRILLDSLEILKM